MNFLINNIGWFFGIAIVSILALIGYKADNKEKQQSNTNPKYIPKDEKINELKQEINNKEKLQNDDFYYNPTESTNEQPKENIENDEMADLYEPLNPIQNESTNKNIEKTEEKSNVQVEQYQKEEIKPTLNDTQQEQSQQIVPDFNNIENLNISLQDLENKKYNDLLNKINDNITPEPKEIVQNNEEPQQETIQNNEIPQQEIEQQINEPQQNIENLNENNDIKGQENDIENNSQFVNEVSEPQQEQTVQETQNTEEISNQEIPQEQNNNQNNIEESKNENQEINEFAFNQPESNYTGEIPEIFSNVEQNNEMSEQSQLEKIENTNDEQIETNLNNQSNDDDIWKF